jgi:hypothetical protein
MSQIQHINRKKKQQELCDQFNELYQVGTQVKYWKGLKEGEPTGTAPTRSRAEMLGGHTASVWLEGVRGCIGLSHIEVI